MCCWFVVAQWLQDNSIVDIAWGLGFVSICAWLLWHYQSSFSYRVLSVVTFLWGFRLSIYILIRRLSSKREDWRYENWRKQWGRRHRLMAFLRVFMLQGFFMFIIALPLMQVRGGVEAFTLVQYTALASFAFGFLWESIADWQLFQFKSKPENKGKILQKGLWAYSRHPNYFGEIVIWWSIFLLAIPQGNWWLSICSPITITLVLIKISEPMLEAKMRQNAAFRAYVQQTNAFIPKLF